MTNKKTDTTPAPDKDAEAAAALAANANAEPGDPLVDELHPVEKCEAEITQVLDGYQMPHMKGRIDQRLVSIARTQIELGFLALYKALALAEGEE